MVVIGLLGNGLVLYLSLVHNALKLDSVSLMFVHNLAVSDILLTLLMFLPMLVTLVGRRWVLGNALCFITAFFFTCPITNEILTILSISGTFLGILYVLTSNDQSLINFFRM